MLHRRLSPCGFLKVIGRWSFLKPPFCTKAATWMIGRDDSGSHYTVLYSDERGVSRVYAMTLDHATWRIWRENEEFSQRFEAVVSADHDLISGHWEKRTGGGAWEHDFAVTYRRAG